MSHPDFEPGTYRARGVTALLGKTSKGSEQIAVQLVFTGGQYDGKHITWYGYFSDATVERTLDSLRHLGWQGDELFNLAGIDANDVEIVVEDDTNDKGEVRSRVRWINRISGPALKTQLSPAEAQAFAARMKGRVVAHRQKAPANGGGARTAPKQSDRSALDDAPPPHDDSDIPF